MQNSDPASPVSPYSIPPSPDRSRDFSISPENLAQGLAQFTIPWKLCVQLLAHMCDYCQTIHMYPDGSWKNVWHAGQNHPAMRGIRLENLEASVIPEDRDHFHMICQSVFTGTVPYTQRTYRLKNPIDNSIHQVSEHIISFLKQQTRIIILAGRDLGIAPLPSEQPPSIPPLSPDAIQLLDAFPNLSIVLDRNGVYRYIPKGPSENLYKTASRTVGSSIHDSLPQEVAERMQHMIERTLDSKTPQIVEYAIPSPTGPQWHQSRFSPVFLSGEWLTVWNIQPISDTTQQEDEDKRLQTIGSYTTQTIHSLNNLLQVAIIHCHLALEADSTPPDSPVHDIRNALHTAVGFSRDILLYATQPSQDQPTHPLSPQSTLRSMNNLFRIMVPRNIKLSTHIQPDTPDILIQRPHLQQLLLNLLSNASRAIGDAEGHIQIRLQPAQLTPELLSSCIIQQCSIQDSCVELQVQDSGHGMDAKTIQNLSSEQPFTSDQDHHHGLGFPHILRILRSIGGTVLIESKPNKGTRMRVFLKTP